MGGAAGLGNGTYLLLRGGPAARDCEDARAAEIFQAWSRRGFEIAVAESTERIGRPRENSGGGASEPGAHEIHAGNPGVQAGVCKPRKESNPRACHAGSHAETDLQNLARKAIRFGVRPEEIG